MVNGFCFVHTRDGVLMNVLQVGSQLFPRKISIFTFCSARGLVKIRKQKIKTLEDCQGRLIVKILPVQQTVYRCS